MIRRAELGDCARLAEIHRQGFEAGWDETTLSQMVLRPHNHIYLVEDGGQAASFVALTVVAGEAEILTLATDPKYRARGLARTVLTHSLAESNAQTVFLEVAVDNDAALRLYEGLGFERTGLRKAYYARRGGVCVDALILRLALPHA